MRAVIPRATACRRCTTPYCLRRHRSSCRRTSRGRSCDRRYGRPVTVRRRPGVPPPSRWSDRPGVARSARAMSSASERVFGGSGKASLGSLAVSGFPSRLPHGRSSSAPSRWVLVGGMLGLGSLVRPTRPQPEKYLTYECGVDPVGAGWSQSQVRYYIFALLFVHVRRRGRVHLPVGHPARGLRRASAWSRWSSSSSSSPSAWSTPGARGSCAGLSRRWV